MLVGALLSRTQLLARAPLHLLFEIDHPNTATWDAFTPPTSATWEHFHSQPRSREMLSLPNHGLVRTLSLPNHGHDDALNPNHGHTDTRLTASLSPPGNQPIG
jgi:hypothetical protein